MEVSTTCLSELSRRCRQTGIPISPSQNRIPQTIFASVPPIPLEQRRWKNAEGMSIGDKFTMPWRGEDITRLFEKASSFHPTGSYIIVKFYVAGAPRYSYIINSFKKTEDGIDLAVVSLESAEKSDVVYMTMFAKILSECIRVDTDESFPLVPLMRVVSPSGMPRHTGTLIGPIMYDRDRVMGLSYICWDNTRQLQIYANDYIQEMLATNKKIEAGVYVVPTSDYSDPMSQFGKVKTVDHLRALGQVEWISTKAPYAPLSTSIVRLGSGGIVDVVPVDSSICEERIRTIVHAIKNPVCGQCPSPLLVSGLLLSAPSVEPPIVLREKYAKDKESVSEDFICKLTKDVMMDPVLTGDGNTYELSEISKWIAINGKYGEFPSPITGEKISVASIVRNNALRNIIQAAEKCAR